MQSNVNLLINVVLLAAVIITIVAVMKNRRRKMDYINETPEERSFSSLLEDDIISVRKIEPEIDETLIDETVSLTVEPEEETPVVGASEPLSKPKEDKPRTSAPEADAKQPPLMLFLLARNEQYFAGYDMLQSLLAAGLRYGEDGLFHRHQDTHGHGPVICSLASATSTGLFDMQNIGAFKEKGLCIYMHRSNNSGIDRERFTIMLDTARQLKDSLDCYLLDDERKHLNEERLNRYHQRLEREELCVI